MSSQAISPFGDRSAMRKHWLQKIVILVGLEPTIPGSLGRCLIHWATGPLADLYETRCHDDDTAQLNNDDVTAQLRAGCPQLPTEFHKTSIPPSTWWLPARWTVRWWGSGHRPMFYPLGYRPRAEFHKISTPPHEREPSSTMMMLPPTCLHKLRSAAWLQKASVAASISLGVMGSGWMSQQMDKKWGQRDSNSQPSDLESDALPLRHSPLLWVAKHCYTSKPTSPISLPRKSHT